MLTDTQLLDYVHKGTEMGRDGVVCVLKYARDNNFRQALRQQMTEYQLLYDTSGQMLRERGHSPAQVGPVAKLSTQLMTSMQIMTDQSTSKIAELMVQGNTMGMTKSYQQLRQYVPGSDGRVKDLADKLLMTEEANIDQMKKFL